MNNTYQKIIIKYCQYLTADVEDVGSKPWMLTAIISHCNEEMKRRKFFILRPEVKKIVTAWFNQHW